jgi:hypothetical protein
MNISASFWGVSKVKGTPKPDQAASEPATIRQDFLTSSAKMVAS